MKLVVFEVCEDPSISSSSNISVCCLYSSLAVPMRGHWQQYVFVSNFLYGLAQKFPRDVSARRLMLLSSESMNNVKLHLNVADFDL